MGQISCGLLMYKRRSEVQFFLVHPGGPFFQRKDEGAWTIPKGLLEEKEELLQAAQREFAEETGLVPRGPYLPLGTTKMSSGKIIHAWAFEGEWEEAGGIRSNNIELEWPPRSGKKMQVPEADRGKWCSYSDALRLIHPAQKVFVEKAHTLLV